jgi:hypothetical protein
MSRRRIKDNKIFILSWATPEEEFLVRPLETFKYEKIGPVIILL